MRNYPFAFLVFLLLMGSWSCGAKQKNAWDPGPAIRGLNLSGNWHSPDFGDMKLVQDRGIVSGTYKHPRGPDHNGRIRGTITGDVITLNWVQPGNVDAAIMPVKGKAYWKIAPSGRSLKGRWGFDQSIDDGGVWTAEKSAYN